MKVPHTAVAIAVGAGVGGAIGYAVDKYVIAPKCDNHDVDSEDTKALDAEADALDVPAPAAFVPEP